MNKFLFVVSLVFMFFSMNAIAEDKPIEIDGKHILLTDFSVRHSDLPDFKKESLNNGIYIIAWAGAMDKRLPNAEKMISEVFRSKGFKISDTLEGSSFAIAFTVPNGAIDIVRADKQAGYSASPNSSQVATHAGALANSVLSGIGNGGGGAVGLAGWAIAELLQSDSNFGIIGTIFKEPTKYKGFLGERIKGSDDKRYGTMSFVFYKLEKGKEASDDVVLKMGVNEWIDHFMPAHNVNTQNADTKPVETPAPVITNTTPALIPAEATQPQVQ